MYLDRLQELFEASIENVHGRGAAGHAAATIRRWSNHVLMGMALVRTDPKGRKLPDLPRTCAPRAEWDSNVRPMGTARRSRLAAQRQAGQCAARCAIQHLSRTLPGRRTRCYEDLNVEAPHVGCASTRANLYPLCRDAAPPRRRARRCPNPFSYDAQAREAGAQPATCPTSCTSAFAENRLAGR
jgi:hypothetical protein